MILRPICILAATEAKRCSQVRTGKSDRQSIRIRILSDSYLSTLLKLTTQATLLGAHCVPPKVQLMDSFIGQKTHQPSTCVWPGLPVRLLQHISNMIVLSTSPRPFKTPRSSKGMFEKATLSLQDAQSFLRQSLSNHLRSQHPVARNGHQAVENLGEGSVMS